mmetsp:Transcript_64288/g.106857  ORF Transcript_64288/g.106857 Transcript_64288/m.106857 type:complete len:215 (+) Transcript_64288:887-1531(+)
MVHGRTMPGWGRLEVAYRIQIGYVHAIFIWLGTVGPILLHIKSKKADVDAVTLLESEQSLRLVRELLRVISTKCLLMLNKPFWRVRSHQQRRDDANRHGLAYDLGCLQIYRHLLLDESAHRNHGEILGIVIEYSFADLIRHRLQSSAVDAIIRPVALVLHVIIHTAHPMPPLVANFALHPPVIYVFGQHRRIAPLSSLRQWSLLETIKVQCLAF